SFIEEDERFFHGFHALGGVRDTSFNHVYFGQPNQVNTSISIIACSHKLTSGVGHIRRAKPSYSATLFCTDPPMCDCVSKAYVVQPIEQPIRMFRNPNKSRAANRADPVDTLCLCQTKL